MIIELPDLYAMTKVLITAATTAEWMPAFEQVNAHKTTTENAQVTFHVSGVGMLASAVSLTKLVLEEKPDIIIQAGIAGTFNQQLSLGSSVVVRDEILGDMGVEENGIWKDIFDLKLEGDNLHPFEKKQLPNPFLQQYNLLQLPEVVSVTVNEISTHANRIHQIVQKYHPDIESMEGAALHYVCRKVNIPFLQIRSLSNYVGERDKTKWKMKEAITNLNEVLLRYIDKFNNI